MSVKIYYISGNVDELIYNIKDIYYKSFIVNCPFSPDIILREIIKSSCNFHMYNGMPLNIEYRAFIDFNTKQIIDIIDYWDESLEEDIKRQMISEKDLNMCRQLGLNVEDNREDLNNFKNFKQETREHFKQYKQILEEKLQKDISNFELSGIWSVDFLLDSDNSFHLIDMALASDSWGEHLIDKNKFDSYLMNE